MPQRQIRFRGDESSLLSVLWKTKKGERTATERRQDERDRERIREACSSFSSGSYGRREKKRSRRDRELGKRGRVCFQIFPSQVSRSTPGSFYQLTIRIVKRLHSLFFFLCFSFLSLSKTFYMNVTISFSTAILRILTRGRKLSFLCASLVLSMTLSHLLSLILVVISLL